MFKFVLKWSSVATKPLASKFYSSAVPQHEQIARQMINYAVGHARCEKSGESYAQAILILEQGLSNAKDNTKGIFMLAMSTLLYERKFNEAEDLLTKELIQAEKHFGTTHPKVGVVLTCIALMYKNKARMEASSGILVQEGLYRKAIDLLKAPALEKEVADMQV